MKRHLTIITLSLALVSIILEGNSVLGQQKRSGSGGEAWDYLRDKYDANGDGQLTAAEYTRGPDKFQRLDANRDGVISPKDWGGVNSRKKSFGGRQKRSLDSSEVSPPAKGDKAPGFKLAYVNEPLKTVELASFQGSKPVALVFGSCS